MGTPIAIDEAKGGLDALVCASIDDLVFETPSYTSVMLCPSSERATHLCDHTPHHDPTRTVRNETFALFILS